MAVLKALTATQRRIIAASTKPVRVAPPKPAEFDVTGHDVTKCKTTGKPLRAQKWYQADYRSFTPKGIVLITRKGEPRWGKN